MKFLTLSGLLLIHGITFSAAPKNQVCLPLPPIAKNNFVLANIDSRDARVPRVSVETHNPIPRSAKYSLEFVKLQRDVERALKATFNTDLVEVKLLRYLRDEEGAHTVLNLIPRLAKPVTITDEATGETHTYEDQCYGKPLDPNAKYLRTTTPAMWLATVRAIQKNLGLPEEKEVARKAKKYDLFSNYPKGKKYDLFSDYPLKAEKYGLSYMMIQQPKLSNYRV